MLKLLAGVLSLSAIFGMLALAIWARRRNAKFHGDDRRSKATEVLNNLLQGNRAQAAEDYFFGNLPRPLEVFGKVVAVVAFVAIAGIVVILILGPVRQYGGW